MGLSRATSFAARIGKTEVRCQNESGYMLENWTIQIQESDNEIDVLPYFYHVLVFTAHFY